MNRRLNPTMAWLAATSSGSRRQRGASTPALEDKFRSRMLGVRGLEEAGPMTSSTQTAWSTPMPM